MKLMYNGRKFVIYAALGVSGALAGCYTSANRGTDIGSGGAGGDYGNNCMWDGTGGGVSIPDCSDYRGSIHFVGTLDGKQYDDLSTNNPTAVDTIATDDISHALDVVLPGNGYLHLWWSGITPKGEWIEVGGELLLPEEKSLRFVQEGSRIRLKCGASLYQYILIIDGGELAACSVN